ncbi:hypothetical protein G3N55_00120 [Dissulfurirhabdus thermomarina]|uniref:Uncharacterized protein n=1 Tax=Dissulfurirhabdus thermomarina TaxID=1765737 RepID=A0A6N9TJ23_DISTH|nr:hypothetical protein [Dissulfurirhabdus thermomarina]NDY41255.1 hypothetical protein [Dissulfurirhabdus thermomarina]
MALRDYLDADLATCLDPGEFGVDATYTPAAGQPVVLAGILEAGYAASEEVGPGGVSVEGLRPILTCRELDLPAGAGHGDQVAIGSDLYSVVGIEPDGYGLVALVLERT